MIQNTIDVVNQRIVQQILSPAVQTAAIAVPVFDQQANAMALALIGSQSRLGIDDRYVWQSAHLADGSRVTDTKTWGSFTDHYHRVQFILIGVSKRPNGFTSALLALDGVAGLIIDSVNNKTLEVLTRYWYLKAGSNYDPALCAFAIAYHFEGVTDEEFAEVAGIAEIAQLPVEQPVIALPPNPVTEPDSVLTAKYACAVALSGGRLVRETPAGLTYYDATQRTHAFSLLGVSLQAGGVSDAIDVGLEGLINHVGWSLTPGVTYLAGPAGQVIPSSAAESTPGLAFQQIIGVAVDADTLNLNPQTPIFLT